MVQSCEVAYQLAREGVHNHNPAGLPAEDELSPRERGLLAAEQVAAHELKELRLRHTPIMLSRRNRRASQTRAPEGVLWIRSPAGAPIGGPGQRGVSIVRSSAVRAAATASAGRGSVVGKAVPVVCACEIGSDWCRTRRRPELGRVALVRRGDRGMVSSCLANAI